MTTGKNTALAIWAFVGKVISLHFNMLSWFVIAFLPWSKYLLISWLWSPSVVIWEPKKIKSVTVSIFPPSVCHEVMGLDAMIFSPFSCFPLFLWIDHWGRLSYLFLLFLKFFIQMGLSFLLSFAFCLSSFLSCL